jgi:hypothetical protein
MDTIIRFLKYYSFEDKGMPYLGLCSDDQLIRCHYFLSNGIGEKYKEMLDRGVGARMSDV